MRPNQRIAIFERDNWTCQLCGQPTPRELLGKHPPHPHTPTIGHIIPKARLSWPKPTRPDDVRCECLACNNRKGDRLDSELASDTRHNLAAINRTPGALATHET